MGEDITSLKTGKHPTLGGFLMCLARSVESAKSSNTITLLRTSSVKTSRKGH